MVELNSLIHYEEEQTELYLRKASNCKKHRVLSFGSDPTTLESIAEIHQSIADYLRELKQYREKYGKQNVTTESEL